MIEKFSYQAIFFFFLINEKVTALLYKQVKSILTLRT